MPGEPHTTGLKRGGLSVAMAQAVLSWDVVGYLRGGSPQWTGASPLENDQSLVFFAGR